MRATDEQDEACNTISVRTAILFIPLFFLPVFARSFRIFQPEQFMSSIEIIGHHGYPAESHRVVTEDGYILTLHRIPYGKFKGKSPSSRPPILLIHGLMGTSFDYLSLLPEQSLSFSLADAGFDVWLGNNRGNIYSNEHVYFDTNDQRFWNFSTDEMARWDSPAMIDFVLNKTNTSRINVVATSQGGLTLMVGAAENAELASKINHLFALAPPLILTTIRGFIIGSLTEFTELAQMVLSLVPEQIFSFPFSLPFCGIRLLEPLCSFLLADVTGNSQQMNKVRLPIYISKIPGGTSTKNLMHWLQAAMNGTRHFDYGEEGNMKEYGTPFPRPYDFSNYSVPTSLYFSPADHLMTNENIMVALSMLPKTAVVSRNLTGFGHFDFLFGDRAKEEIYDEIIHKLQDWGT